MNESIIGKLGLLLDNDIIIKNLYGSSSIKDKIQEIFSDNERSVLKLTLGEFKRSVLKDLVVFYNDLIEFIVGQDNEDPSSQLGLLMDFLLDYKKNYGVNAKGRYLNYVIKIFENIINHIDKSKDTPLEITVDLIKNQIIDYMEIFFFQINIIGDSLNCPHSEIEPVRDQDRFERLSFSCQNCEVSKMNLILDIFENEIEAILNSTISNHLIDLLKYIMGLDSVKEIDGRKHVCINLVDLLLILNCPEGYTIFTSNYSHFNELCVLLDKSAVYLQT